MISLDAFLSDFRLRLGIVKTSFPSALAFAKVWFFWASFDLTSWYIARYAPANLNQNLHQNNSKNIQA